MVRDAGQFRWLSLLLGSVLCLGGDALLADETESVALGHGILFEMLDSVSCQRRTMAWEQLRAEANFSDPKPLLAAVRLELENPGISFEKQERLLLLEKDLIQRLDVREAETLLPTASVELSKEKLEQMDCWRGLVSDVPQRRSLAERQAENCLNSGESTYGIMQILRGIIVDESISADDRNRVWKLERKARKAWLEHASESRNEVVFTESQVQEWVNFLAAANLPEDQLVPWMDLDERVTVQFSVTAKEDPLGGDGLPFLEQYHSHDEISLSQRKSEPQGEISATAGNVQTQKGAVIKGGEKKQTSGLKVWETVQQLEDALICNESSQFTIRMIDEKLTSQKVTPAGTILLKRLAFLVKPCMAAEFWTNGEMKGSQFLRIGVPQDCGVGTSFFDSILGETVHCQGGTNLVPGDYPLEIAIQHPNQSSAFFYLTALDTPAKKILYPWRMKEETHERWSQISKRTLEHLERTRAEQRRLLTFDEIRFLKLLEPHEISKQIGFWLETLQDDPNWGKGPGVPLELRLNGGGSHHACLCGVLMSVGTKEALPALLQQLEEKPIWMESAVDSFRVDYLAALAITEREPWDGAEEWLESLLTGDVVLIRHAEQDLNSPMVSASPGNGKKNKVETQGVSASASAAGILLAWRGESLDGLEVVTFLQENVKGAVFYRFEDETVQKEICQKLTVK